MPAGRERVPNRQLSGDELKRLITADTARLLDNCGLLSPHIGYGRVGYEIIVRLHLDNADHPLDETRIGSRGVARNIIATQPELAAVETAPLASPSPGAVATAIRRERSVYSPNVERLREGIPVPVEVRQHDGSVVTESIAYPPDPTLEDGGIEASGPALTELKKDWALLDVAQPVSLLDVAGEPSQLEPRP